ncbi:MAG: hypothetical protein WCS96_13980 [Victivallales bacterium]
MFNKFLARVDSIGAIPYLVQDSQVVSGSTSDVKNFSVLVKRLLEVYGDSILSIIGSASEIIGITFIIL